MSPRAMRHLRVPRPQTTMWIEFCKAKGWYGSGYRVLSVDGDSAIPLNSAAPGSEDASWEGLSFVDLERSEKHTRHYWDHLSPELRHEAMEILPHSFEIQGDVLLVKVPESLFQHEKEIAEAMLKQFPNVRVVCHDEGVEGEFRIRNLRVLSSRNNDSTTETTYKEHGHEFQINPAEVYFSGRLSTQRKSTFEAVKSFKQTKGRPLVVCDPYAGVGPSLALLHSNAELVSASYVNDMNPSAKRLLAANMEKFHQMRKQGGEYFVDCMDARELVTARPQYAGCADVLLVNLPHDGIEHLPELLPLLKDEETLVCGWTIVDRETDVLSNLYTQVQDSKRSIQTYDIQEIKGFSTTKAMYRYELILSRPNNR